LAAMYETCPATPVILKRMLEQAPKMKLDQVFQKSCINEIEEHYIKGDTDWIEMTPVWWNSTFAESMMGASILSNPLATLKMISQSNYLTENLGFICVYTVYVDEPDLSEKTENAAEQLKEFNNLSPAVDVLRQRCVHYFEKAKERIIDRKDRCPKTPEGTADLIQEDNGVSLILDSKYCPNDLFDSLRTGDQKWLTLLAPVLMDSPRTETMLDLTKRFQRTLIFALPRNPEATFNIIAKYFPDKVDEVCYSKTILENHEEGNIDEYTESQVMDIPGAISGLKTLKLKDKKQIQIRDHCVDRLEYTLKTAQHISMNGGPD
jgi:hypothetical protein